MPGIVKRPVPARICQVTGLTRKEQVVLAILLGPFLVGWTVKIWRQARIQDAGVEAVFED